MDNVVIFNKVDDNYIAKIKGMRYQVLGFGYSEQEAAKDLMLKLEKCKDVLNILNKKN
jgi:hypothetical protein